MQSGSFRSVRWRAIGLTPEQNGRDSVSVLDVSLFPGLASALPRSNRLVFDGDTICVGVVRCSPEADDFGADCRSECYCFAFPRSAVTISPAGRRPFVEDASIASFYNEGQEYARRELSPEGDRCEWFGLATTIVREAVRPFDPEASESDRIFRFSTVRTPPILYLRQRVLFERARRSGTSALWIEEEVVRLLIDVISAAYPRARPSAVGEEVHARELADAALAELDRRCPAAPSLSGLASSLGVSVYQLCRAFRSVHRSTIHRHVVDLRLRRALESLDNRRTELADLALSLGFSHHSHFSFAFRRQYGSTPSAVGRLLARTSARGSSATGTSAATGN